MAAINPIEKRRQEAKEVAMGIVTDALLDVAAQYGVPIPLIKVDVIPKLLKRMIKGGVDPKVTRRLLMNFMKVPSAPYKKVKDIVLRSGWPADRGIYYNAPASTVMIGTKRMGRDVTAGVHRGRELSRYRTPGHELTHAYQDEPGPSRLRTLDELRAELVEKMNVSGTAPTYDYIKFWANDPTEMHAEAMAGLIDSRPLRKPLTSKQYEKISDIVARKAEETILRRLAGEIPLAEPMKNYYLGKPAQGKFPPGSKLK